MKEKQKTEPAVGWLCFLFAVVLSRFDAVVQKTEGLPHEKEKAIKKEHRSERVSIVRSGVLITHSFFRLDAGCIEPSPFGLLP